MPLQIDYTETKSFQVAAITGSIRVQHVAELKAAFQALADRGGNVALNLTFIPEIDKSAMSLFINMQKRVNSQGRQFCLVGPTPKVSRLFGEANLLTKIAVYPTLESFYDAASDVSESLYPPADYNFEEKLFKVLSLKCELCGAENIRGILLNRKTQEIFFDDKQLAPTFRGKADYNTLDILSLMITLCSGCYFASRHVSYFSATNGEFKSFLVEKERVTLVKEMGQRRQLAKAGGFSAADELRPPFAGSHLIYAYQLAEESAHALHRSGNRLAVYDLGLYNAVLTRFCERNNQAEHLRKAYMWFGELEKHRDDYSKAMVLEACYYLCVIGLALKKPKEAKKYLIELRALGAENGAGDTAAFLAAAEARFAKEEPA